MRKIIILTLLILFPIIANAKRPAIKKFEFEIGVNHTFAAPDFKADDVDYKFGFYLEGRFNLNKVPVDLGFQFNYSNVYLYGGADYQMQYKAEMRNLSFLIISDYAFRRKSIINPYVGFGLGVTINKDMNINFKSNKFEDHGERGYLLCTPRLGVKFWNRLNLGFEYALGHKNIRRSQIKLGYYF